MTNIIQGSPEWFDIRRGKVTASRVADVIAKTRNGWGASRANYMAQLIAERLTGTTAESFSNATMQWGTDTEPQARAAYEFMQDVDVTEIGFVVHPLITASGASPDGLVGENGMVEIKCPNTATHIDTLLGKGIPSRYLTQMQWQIACTGREWCDFVSYNPRMPERMNLFVERIAADRELARELEGHIQEFIGELDDKVASLNASYALPEMEQAS